MNFASFGRHVFVGIVAAFVTGAALSFALHPTVAAELPAAGGWDWLLSRVAAALIGYVAAIVVWGLTVALLMLRMSKGVTDTP